MKPLDDHLRDASSSWMQELRPTMVESAAKISPSIAKSAFPTGFIVGGLSSVAIVATVWWAVGTQDESAASSVATNSPDRTEQVVQEAPRTAESTVRRDPVVSKDVRTDAAPEVVTVPTAQVQAPEGFNSNGMVDGFTLEYERVLARAMEFESEQPMRAATEYIGLGKLCLARQQYAHAVSALQRAEELCRRGRYEHLMPEVRQLLDDAQQRLQP